MFPQDILSTNRYTESPLLSHNLFFGEKKFKDIIGDDFFLNLFRTLKIGALLK